MSSGVESIDVLASALVREHLSNKGLFVTLRALDVESPRLEGSINSRQILALAIGIRRPPKGQGSILDALVRRLLARKANTNVHERQQPREGEFEASFPSTTTDSCSPLSLNPFLVSAKRVDMTNKLPATDEIAQNKEESSPILSNEGSSTNSAFENENVEENSDSRNNITSTSVENHDVEPGCTDSYEVASIHPPSSSSPIDTDVHPTSPEPEDRASPLSIDVTTPHSDLKVKDNSTVLNLSEEELIEDKEEETAYLSSPISHPESSRVMNTVTLKSNVLVLTSPQEVSEVPRQKVQQPSPTSPLVTDLPEQKTSSSTVMDEQPIRTFSLSDSPVESGGRESATASPGLPRPSSAPSPDGGSPLALPAAMQLKTLLLGDAEEQFPNVWKEEGITFNPRPGLTYGIELYTEGPCGALAALQGFVLKALLFGGPHSPATALEPSAEKCHAALVTAVSEVLWQCGQRREACLAIPASDGALLAGNGRYRRDGVTEALQLVMFDNLTSLKEGVERHVRRLQEPGGCALFVCSAVLSRGLVQTAADMVDACAPLLVRGGECAPELVSLILTGRASMKDEKPGCDNYLRGVPARADVGLLTLAEHYGQCQVGSFLKTPRYPIWLVLARGKYSLLFSTRRQLVSDWRAELAFRLHHYAGAGQEKPVQLAVACGKWTEDQQREEDHGAPPLELVIRTKWNGAVVQWL